MKKNVINCRKHEFVPGRTLRATVKTVNKTGVVVKMPAGRGSGTILSRCWGSGIERERAFAAIRPGDEFDVVVRSYDARAMTLALVLVGYEHLVPSTSHKPNAVGQDVAQHQEACHRKPDFVPIAAGTTFLWDAANLLGKAGVENAARTFSAISDSMSKQEYKTMFFIERRCLTWALHNQSSAEEAAELDAFSRQCNVVVVGNGGSGLGEADCAILQMAEALPGSICVTCDRYEDYAHAYPGIVGTNRIRSFSVAKMSDKTIVLVDGVAHALVVEDGLKSEAIGPCTPPAEMMAQTPTASPVATPSVVAPAQAVEAYAAKSCRGLFAVADKYVRRGDAQGAVRLYARVAKRNPAAYYALAEMYREGRAVCSDSKKARHYERLARASEKRRRECSLRERRMRAEAIRGDRHSVAHFAAKRRAALSLTIFGERHDKIVESRMRRRARGSMGGIHKCAA